MWGAAAKGINIFAHGAGSSRFSLLVIETGASGRMRVDPSTIDDLKNEHIHCVVGVTEDAVTSFNEEAEKGTRVAGVFI